MRKDIYLEAAEIIDRGEFEGACEAIQYTVSQLTYYMRSDPYVQAMKLLFMPRFLVDPWGYWGRAFADTAYECRECRVLMLLFMAEIGVDHEH